ncbi:MAG: hypothetical protein COV74_05445 [Candidatus Omnitrophica bacterium CG11_big_fil_rev_8_21_14_0_20_45_26]|uniref:SPOR domain-containing protein n=1 Tax=Candidatus Abzuiibacterium crystallinum TaxID=1974748 RepID=A0A2H0LPE9_9BACT|nr:MAG: hypothetical protein COV74_05445 [Candidatus Omnitrophica bacterium CG11_big_fil_rev_8_21_14_0_20_45_26]PIW64335.1 MAG: hypothetical protein COW12_06765 [Candidatus Omnitrophica bacterium CG12_big_fil_rev_8_21_14_0_65_45_16]
MWFIFKKKNSNAPLKTLNEQEIQEKLYGRYHQKQKASNHFGTLGSSDETLTLSADNQINLQTKKENKTRPANTAVLDLPKVAKAETPPSHKTYSIPLAPTPIKTTPNLWGYVRDLTNRIFSLFSWRYTVAAMILLAGIGLLSLIPWDKFKSREMPPPVIQRDRAVLRTPIPQETQTPAVVTKIPATAENPDKKATAEESAQGSKVEEKAQQTISTETEKQAISEAQGKNMGEPPVSDVSSAAATQKSYTIQVCTYVQEADAKMLVEKLETENLPAFYQESGNTSGASAGRQFYVVFLGKDKGYSEAKERLAAFKKLSVSKDFSDAFIRRL